MMNQKSILKGALLIAIGASSYGMLATFVKLAYKENFSTAEITGSQFVYGIIGMGLLNFFHNKKVNSKKSEKVSKKEFISLILAGTSMGFTSVFYYLSVRYIDVSIAIVLLMQTVWMGVIVELFLDKKKPTLKHTVAIILVLFGTVLATNLIHNSAQLDWRGILWGLLAAMSFTATMFTSNRIAVHLPITTRSLYMLFGGAIVVFIFGMITQETPFQFDIFLKWGLLLAVFGTIIPPLLLNAGFPLTGISLGSIISSLELPVSIIMAYLVLNEIVIIEQWVGVGLIILAVVLMNFKFNKKTNVI